MFSKILKLIFVFTSMSPVLLTFWFKEFSKNWMILNGIEFLIVGIVLLIILFCIIRMAKNKLEELPVTIQEISTADNESLVFIFSYLIPLLDISTTMLIFMLFLFLIIIWTTNIYHFNPVLGILGYHQYEVKLDNGISFILITKKTLMNTKQISKIVQLTNYIIIDKE